MNSGKVRVYELSKELNLDNKDILTVCADLNILVKSHSSTITETEADRIRAAAPKYSSGHSTPNKSPITSSPGTGSSPREAVSKPIVKKQQILGIRRHAPGAASSQGNAGAEEATQPLAAAPTISSPQVRPALRNPTLSNRPVRSGSEEAPEPDELPVAVPQVDQPEEPELNLVGPDPVDDEQPQVKQQPVQEPEQPQPQAKPTVSAKVNRQSELVERPSRANSSTGTVSRPALVDRPVLKQSRGADAPTGSGNRPPLVKSAQNRQVDDAASPDAQRRRGPSESGVNDIQLLSRPQVPELQRPKVVRPRLDKPTQDGGQPVGRAPMAPGNGPDGQPIPLLDGDDARRPIAPKPRRVKDREEEEDDLQEIPQKVAKVGVKGKRRNQPSLDDDFEEDFIGDDVSIPEPIVQVSLSLARPPKPKGRPGQPKMVAPIAAPSKGKKPTSGENLGRHRRDRREEIKRERPEKITLTGNVSVQELADMLGIPETDIIKALFFKGIAANINQTLDVSTATTLAQEFEVEVETAEKESEARKLTEMLDAKDLENLQRRPPVVTIMGHVDHGKTTLLDSIRKTKVAQGEAGGITQHIGAYHVDVEHEGNMQQVVFLDTPGHQAFTAMRARGARVTDIAVLVVAADDGVQPQTIEAISHAKAAEVPIVVAINKIDKIDAQPDRVKQELTEFGLLAEEWGGDTIMVPVSAMTGDNLDTLLEMLLLVAEVEDLYANPDRLSKGTVIEAHLDKAKGPVATLLVQNGTLRVGDILVAGSSLGKVRAMVDDRGKRVDAASPSFAVEVLGLSDVPAAGDEFQVFPDEKEARAIATARSDQQRQSRLQQRALAARQVSLTSLSERAKEGELKELNLILKADVQGSLEAILAALQQLPQNEVRLRVLLSAPGEVTETDVDLAAASAAVIIGFNTTLASGARQAADEAVVDIREYNIIYKLLDDIQGAMEGLLEPELVEEHLGQVEVRATFPVGRGMVAGCYVLSGKAIRNCNVRVLRSGTVVYQGTLDSLKRMKEDTREVNAGYECGIGINNFNDWKEGDIIDTYRMVAKRRTLSPA
ncbi:translation initiation factor IF-2 [Leptolyngbya sp. 'hensonii']|uniref:translation initiation factor IF-2 n=1 Tax=Leptolyngbya sp. 'hensonii' TaxID=1922337 RepID=UPI00094FE8CD|nr:translation initiation factor IF-2 [Leptolyngbya sp. 'hensonii']OLP17559.1 translation initiation factor IF-2 [Leptolyngbya sp. 'hensonii']